MALIKDSIGHTKEHLIAERVKMLRGYKKYLKRNNIQQPHRRKINFEMFRANCRNRKFDAVAGHSYNRATQLYYWVWGR